MLHYNNLKNYKRERLGHNIRQTPKIGKHVNKSVSKAKQIVGIIFRTFAFMDQNMFMTLSKSLVRPHLEYSTPVWSPMLTKDKISVEKKSHKNGKGAIRNTIS